MPPAWLWGGGGSGGSSTFNAVRQWQSMYHVGPVLCITINVPVVYMARDIMVLMLANLLQGLLEGVGPESQDFLKP